MDTHSTKFKVKLGLFVAGGFLIFVITIFLIGREKNLFDPVFKLTTEFHNVGGLQIGNNVRFSGINVGTISNVKIINDTTVQVDMLIKEDAQKFIKTDCQAAIGSEGIIGDRVLIITQGSTGSESVKDDEFISSVEPVEIDGIIKSLNVTAAQLAEIMVNINQGNGTLGRLIRDSTISENIDKTIINLRKSSKGLDENMQAAKSNFLFKGFFNRKAKAAAKAKQDSITQKEEATKKVVK
jgi:phospholipid/cholesterol/gamma-HCH transport system substrate-binding protein